MTITGAIHKVEYMECASKKVLLTVKPNEHETVYVELRGKRTGLASSLKIGLQAQIEVEFDGRRSKIYNKHYNNIVGKSIKII